MAINNSTRSKICSLEGGTFRPSRDLRATEEEDGLTASASLSLADINEESKLKPQGSLSSDETGGGSKSGLNSAKDTH